MMRRLSLLHVLVAVSLSFCPARAADPVPLIYDTDIGNDVDDVLALGMIHALQDRGECRLLAVTVSKDNPDAARFCDLVNTFYGRGGIPIGRVRLGKTPGEGPYAAKVINARDDDKPRYSFDLQGEYDTPRPTPLLRQTLAAAEDQSTVIVVVGFSTNMARLLDSRPDEYAELDGRALVAQKVKQLVMMGGCFAPQRPETFGEYNIRHDLEAARQVFTDWPTPIIISGHEIGKAIPYPALSIERDFDYVPHHPLKDAYEDFMQMPYDRPTWDLTAVLEAVRPDRGYFGLSQPGELSISEDNYAVFTPGGRERDRYLTVTEAQIERVGEALTLLASQPPAATILEVIP